MYAYNSLQTAVIFCVFELHLRTGQTDKRTHVLSRK